MNVCGSCAWCYKEHENETCRQRFGIKPTTQQCDEYKNWRLAGAVFYCHRPRTIFCIGQLYPTSDQFQFEIKNISVLWGDTGFLSTRVRLVPNMPFPWGGPVFAQNMKGRRINLNFDYDVWIPPAIGAGGWRLLPSLPNLYVPQLLELAKTSPGDAKLMTQRILPTVFG